MKIFLTMIGFLFSVAAFTQSGDDVVSALKQGSAAEFSQYFSNSVDVKLPNKDEMKSLKKPDAASAVSVFFSANKIKGFDVISQREMNGTMYIAGKLTGSQSYNMTVMLKNSGKAMEVITIRIS